MIKLLHQPQDKELKNTN